MNKTVFDKLADSTAVEQYTLHCGDISCEILTYGGTVKSLTVPDKNGNAVDVLLGFDSINGYMGQDGYIGALVGRYANRIGGSSFQLGGKTYALYSNEVAHDLCETQTLVAHQHHTRHKVVHRTEEYAAKGNPDEGDRAEAGAEDSSEDRAYTCDIEQLNEEYAPLRHRHIVHSVVELLAWNRGICINAAHALKILAIAKVGDYQHYKTTYKSNHIR